MGSTNKESRIATGPVSIYGASDDLVEIEGGVSDEIGSYEKAVVFTIGEAEAKPGENAAGVQVRIRYAPKWCGGGVWTAEVAPIDEDVAIPWPVSVRMGGRGYSAVVDVACPPGTRVEWRSDSRDGDEAAA